MVLATTILILNLSWLPPADIPSIVTPNTNAAATTSSVATQPANAQPNEPAKALTAAALPEPSESPRFTAESLDPAGQNSQSLSTIRVNSIRPATPYKVVYAEKTPSRRKWLLLAIAEHSAATFDAYSTREAVSAGAREDDPLMRPFAQSPAIYAAIQGCPLVLDYAARHMQRSPNNLLRHTWWLPQSVGTGMFLFSGAHNLHLAHP